MDELPEIDAKMLAAELEAVIATAGDPLTRFINSIENLEVRRYIEDTVRLKQNLISNTQRMLVSSNPSEVAGYAQWISQNAHEVGYRWCMLRHTLERWMNLQAEPFLIKVHRKGADDGAAP